MAVHTENFVAIRRLHPRVSWRPQGRVIVGKPADSKELDYRDLLSEANECYFHREYAIALQFYLELRQKILVQSHPELPATGGILDHLVLDATVIQPERLIELSRRLLTKVDPAGPIALPADDRRLFSPDEVPENEVLAKFGTLRLDPDVFAPAVVVGLRDKARRLVASGDQKKALRVYEQQVKVAMSGGALKEAADGLAEQAAMLATYGDTGQREQAVALFQEATTIYRKLGDVAAQDTVTRNLDTLRDGQPLPRRRRTSNGPFRLPDPVTDEVFLVPVGDTVVSSAAVVTEAANRAETRSVGVLSGGTSTVLSLESAQWQTSIKDLLDARKSASSLADLVVTEVNPPTFVAYLTHLFFYTLPLVIADTYAALGQYGKAVEHYTSVLKYPWLNPSIEGADLWRRLGSTQLRWGDELFRRGRPALARPHYEQILTLPYAVPAGSPLYTPTAFAACRSDAGEVVKQLLGQPSNVDNPRVAQVVLAAATQLRKIAAGLNFLGLSADYVPVLRFIYLQGAANYFADNAIQAERTFVQFRSQAEQQKFERMQLENSVALSEVAVAVEEKRLEDAQLEVEAARRTRELTEVREANAQANLADWDTIGRELASVNAALSWAANAANDQKITYTGVRYHGERHDYSGDVEDFFDTVGEVREWLNFDLQRNRLARQVAEAAAEVAVVQVREQQAEVRLEVQALNVALAEVRLQGAREVLDYAEDRMFDEDLWFRLAAELQDLARGYLDMAIEAAYVMERAYAAEFDRDLRRIRLDYGLGGPEGLLGGDHLKQDIASFTLDYIQHAQKQNPMRVQLSLREEFPQAFAQFQATGVLAFRTDLELFDRRFPGTYRRKIKRVELFVEGLIPPSGVNGTLRHDGVSTEWRPAASGWAKHTKVVPAETMLLSSYQYRRDYAVLAPREEVLTLFENLGPQGNWTLVFWPSANDLDFGSVSDVTFVVYLDADTDSGLETHTRTLYGTTGGRAFVRSARLHEPDEYFLLERDRALDFRVLTQHLPAWVTSPTLTGLTVRLVGVEGSAPLSGQQLTVTRASDGSSVVATTDANGAVVGDPTTMAPFDAWKGDPAPDTYTVAFADGNDLTLVVDVQLAVAYTFTYRPDPGV